MDNYQNFIALQLETIKQEKGYDFNIIVATDTAYARMDSFKPNTIYVVIKLLASELTYNIRQQPVQIMVTGDQNKSDQVNELMEEFVARNNWTSTLENGVYTKQQYNTPVVISNFNEVGYGYRSVIYINGIIQIMEEIIDVDSFTIDGKEYKPIGLQVGYQMSGNTQALGNTRIAVTEKNTATLSVSFTLPFSEKDFIKDALNIMSETESGNKEFAVVITFTTTPQIQINTTMKLISANMNTAPNQAPSIQIGLMR